MLDSGLIELPFVKYVCGCVCLPVCADQHTHTHTLLQGSVHGANLLISDGSSGRLQQSVTFSKSKEWPRMTIMSTHTHTHVHPVFLCPLSLSFPFALFASPPYFIPFRLIPSSLLSASLPPTVISARSQPVREREGWEAAESSGGRDGADFNDALQDERRRKREETAIGPGRDIYEAFIA